MKRTKAFWKAFGVTMALALVGLLLITAETHRECASIPEDVGSCSRVERIASLAPVVILIAVPMSIFIGIIAEAMQPEGSITKSKKKNKKVT